MKIMHVVGNRPQFIKLMPFIMATRARKHIQNVVVHSGQHYDYEMSQIFFEQLDLPQANYNLEVGSASGNVQTGLTLQRIDELIEHEKPSVIVVYGDTNTTLAGAIAGYKRKVRVAHVEAGMREYIWRPEEINKKTADHCSDFCFCPIKRAVQNLYREGISESQVFFTGDITFDAFRMCCDIVRSQYVSAPVDHPYLLMTMHRAETVNEFQRVNGILSALEEIQMPVIYPMHPHTWNSLHRMGLLMRLEKMGHVKCIKPVGHLDFLKLLMNADGVVTDSGGVIKEAFYARKHCVTIDETTEYTEIFDLGWNVLAGFCQNKIVECVQGMLQKNKASYQDPPPIFGDGYAAEKMVQVIETHLK